MKFFSNKDNMKNTEEIKDINLLRFLIGKASEEIRVNVPDRIDFQTKLFEIIENCYDNSEGYDLIIITKDGVEYYVHENILFNFEYFKIKYNNEKKILLNEYSSTSIELIIQLFYNKTITVPNNFNDIMDIFDFLNMNCLFEDSLNLLKKLELYILNEEDTISLLEIYSNHYNLNYPNEITEYWNTFYSKLFDFISNRKDLDHYFNIYKYFFDKNEKIIEKIKLMIYDICNEKNYSKIFFQFSEIDINFDIDSFLKRFKHENDITSILIKNQIELNFIKKEIILIKSENIDLKNEIKEIKKLLLKNQN
jgi:hypothetical protein